MVDQNEGAPANVPPSEAKALIEGDYTLLDVRRASTQVCALRASLQGCPQLPRQAAAACACKRPWGAPPAAAASSQCGTHRAPLPSGFRLYMPVHRPAGSLAAFLCLEMQDARGACAGRCAWLHQHPSEA